MKMREKWGGKKITDIIFTSFIINKICLLRSLKTNDLAIHINTNKYKCYNETQLQFQLKFP